MDRPSANSIDTSTGSTRTERHFEFTKTLTPSVAVVEAVSEVLGTDPESIPPLHDFVATDALNRLLTESGSDPETIRVTFDYLDHEITVVGDGTVHVRPATDGTR